MKKVLFILGPTGVGKSDMAITLAKKFNGEIISADSVQVFRRLNIGSAKITKEEMQGVAHHAIDILEPEETFSVFEFVALTKKLIDEISARGHLPIIVGGTGLYVKSLVMGYDFGGQAQTTGLREKYEKLFEEKGLDFLVEKLKELAPETAEKTDVKNARRVIRALEICESGQVPMTLKPDFDAKVFALTKDREKLYADINKRTDIMLKNGLIEEVKGLLDSGVSETCQSMQAIDYKETVLFLKGEISREELSELIKQHTRNYAKRQLTFCRGIEGLEFVDVENRDDAKCILERKIKEWLCQ